MGSVDAWQLAIAEAQHSESPARPGQRISASHGGPGLHWGRRSGSGAHCAACLPTAPWDTDWGKADALRGRLALRRRRAAEGAVPVAAASSKTLPP